MAADLELHDRVLSECVVGAGGSVVKHTGDGMIAVFDDPVAAVGAAAAIQRAIGETTWQQADGVQVRAAVHTGVVYQRDGDVFGTAVNRVARLMGVCPPGGVLVSNAAAGLLTDRAPEGFRLERAGRVELAGFTTPEEAWVLVGVGLATVLLAGEVVTEPAEQVGRVLPSIEDELVGRTDELAAVWDALSGHRLVTLVGVGGMGKTRLALEVAHGASTTFSGGAWWIDLSVATSPEAVVPVAMAAVGALEVPGRTPLQAFCDRFTDCAALVVIDNCEHVLSAAGELAAALRTAAPDVRIVSTSREALGLRGEQLLAVGSLPEADGVELFIERACVVRPDLDIDAHRDTITQLSARLDGIPLAIELAAARCRSMTPVEVLQRLDDRFRLLRGGRTGAERHRTLRAAVEWSYSLLDDDERQVFDTLAVFAGGTLIDGIASVTGLDEIDTLDLVDRLVARSMVVATETALGMRYAQLETLRQFAEDRLVDTGRIDDVRDRHLDWVREMGAWFGQSKFTPAGTAAFRRFCSEVDNLRVAVAHAVGSDRHPLAHEIVDAVVEYAHWRALWEAADWVQPLRLDNGWTDAAALCATFKAAVEQQRGNLRDDEFPFGGVPEHFVLALGRVATWQCLALLFSGADPQQAGDILDRVTLSTDLERFQCEGIQLYVGLFRSLRGELSESEARHLLERARGLVSFAEPTRDELFQARAYMLAALGAVPFAPAEATELAHTAIERANRLGAVLISDVARVAASMARHVSDDPGARVAATRQLRAEVAAALAEQRLVIACSLATGSMELFAPADPAVAAAVVAAYEFHIGHSRWTELGASGVPLEQYRADAVSRASSVTLHQAVEQVLALLDRLIAEAEA